jgi:hypothetical protein
MLITKQKLGLISIAAGKSFEEVFFVKLKIHQFEVPGVISIQKMQQFR